MANEKCLLVYYSLTGNIESLIPMFKKELDIDIIRIESAVPYPIEEKEFWERYHDEIDNLLIPNYKEITTDFSIYNTIILVFPNWSNTFPPVIRTFLSKGLLQNKTIIPFITHDRNGEVDIVKQIKSYTNGNKVSKALVFEGRSLTEDQLRCFVKSELVE